MSLQDQFVESTNPALQSRVRIAACTTAQAIGSEATDTPNHTARATLATQVSRAPQMYTEAFTSMLCGQGITSASSDADIANMVSAVWNTMAGPGSGV